STFFYFSETSSEKRRAFVLTAIALYTLLFSSLFQLQNLPYTQYNNLLRTIALKKLLISVPALTQTDIR
ncbi:MAG: hypothetical protein AAGB12_16255, partial [Pseudomonadota bacterium]